MTMLDRPVILCGKSASGKDYCRRALEQLGFETWRRRTTRPRRPGETDEYIFLDEYTRRDSELITSEFNDWFFVLDRADQPTTNAFIVIAAPRELATLLDTFSNARLVYLDVDREIRAKRLIDRGDDINEVKRRMVADDADFLLLDYSTKFFDDANHLHASSTEEVLQWLTR